MVPVAGSGTDLSTRPTLRTLGPCCPLIASPFANACVGCLSICERQIQGTTRVPTLGIRGRTSLLLVFLDLNWRHAGRSGNSENPGSYMGGWNNYPSNFCSGHDSRGRLGRIINDSTSVEGSRERSKRVGILGTVSLIRSRIFSQSGN